MKPIEQVNQSSAMRPTLPSLPDSRQDRQEPGTCMFCRYRRAPAQQQETSHA
ncbi:hypothetical protein [Massilia sp. LjRoot122]|uniref:hypothetical protein n=1 Tax=Massilia sp. LjRoot122 TaxID=3342257 RepID=UPI003ECEDF54